MFGQFEKLEPYRFHSFVPAINIVSMVYDRENDSVNDLGAASSWRRVMRVDVGDALLSRLAYGKRLVRFTFLMNNPSLRFSPSSWHLRRLCAAVGM